MILSVIAVDKKNYSPVEEGAKLGSVKVTLKDEVITDKDLVALKSVDKGNIFQRLYDGVLDYDGEAGWKINSLLNGQYLPLSEANIGSGSRFYLAMAFMKSSILFRPSIPFSGTFGTLGK